MQSPPYRIALVDDDLEFLDSLNEYFTARGCIVRSWHRPTLAFRFLRRLAPDAVVLDFDMPGMSGLQILERLRRSSATEQLPVLLLTAHDQPEIRDAGWSRQLDDFIPKGTSQGEIHLRLTRAVGRAREARRLRSLSEQPAGPGAMQDFSTALSAAAHQEQTILALQLAELEGLRASDRPELFESFVACFAALAHRLRDLVGTDLSAGGALRDLPLSLEARSGLVYILAGANRSKTQRPDEQPGRAPADRAARSVLAANRYLRRLGGGLRDMLVARENGLVRAPVPQVALLEFQLSARPGGFDLAAFERLATGLLAAATPGFARHAL